MARTTQTSEPPKSDTAPLATHVNAKSGAKVVVCCKLPNGMVLHVDRKITRQEQGPSGYKDVDIWIKDESHPEVRVHGNRTRFGEAPRCEVVGGYAMTTNVDKDFWDAWLRQNKDQLYVTRHLIFALPDLAAAKSSAREHKDQLSGFEPLDPSRRAIPGTDRTEPVDPRWPNRAKLAAGSISAVEEMER